MEQKYVFLYLSLALVAGCQLSENQQTTQKKLISNDGTYLSQYKTVEG